MWASAPSPLPSVATVIAWKNEQVFTLANEVTSELQQGHLARPAARR